MKINANELGGCEVIMQNKRSMLQTFMLDYLGNHRSRLCQPTYENKLLTLNISSAAQYCCLLYITDLERLFTARNEVGARLYFHRRL